MPITLLIHIAAGSVAIVAGYIAIVAAKGAGLHRKSGIVFVWSMVVMAVFAAWLAAVKGEVDNVITGLLTPYLVITALTTMRPPTPVARRVEFGGMLVALVVSAAAITLWLQTVMTGSATRDGVPAAVSLIWGLLALLCALGDARMMRAGGLRGGRRLARHLWRMCLALFIATGSFFLGQADEFPQALRVWPVLITLAVAPLVLMLYWLWRVRMRRTSAGPRPASLRVSVAP